MNKREKISRGIWKNPVRQKENQTGLGKQQSRRESIVGKESGVRETARGRG